MWGPRRAPGHWPPPCPLPAGVPQRRPSLPTSCPGAPRPPMPPCRARCSPPLPTRISGRRALPPFLLALSCTQRPQCHGRKHSSPSPLFPHPPSPLAPNRNRHELRLHLLHPTRLCSLLESEPDSPYPTFPLAMTAARGRGPAGPRRVELRPSPGLRTPPSGLNPLPYPATTLPR